MKKLLIFCGLLLTLLISAPSGAFALNATPQDGTSDLEISIQSVAGERAFAIVIHNAGTDSIGEISLDTTFSNFTVTDSLALPSGFASSNATDNGSYNNTLQKWTGTLEGSQIVALGFIGTAGSIGQQIQVTSTILSSKLSDTSNNVDSNSSNDSASYTSAPIAADPDLVISTRLLTSGPITNGTPVSYEVTLTNSGQGTYIDNPSSSKLGVYFVLPGGVTYTNGLDADTNDPLNVDACGTIGPASSVPGLASYAGDIVGCQFTPVGGVLSPGQSGKVIINLVANTAFATGSTVVVGVAVGDDLDSIRTQATVFAGIDPATITDNNNLVVLAFDNSELKVTVNRCPSQKEFTTDGTGCFRVSFNKLIYAPSFIQDDLALASGVSVTSFSQLDNYTWEVRVKGISRGTTFALTLDPSSVQDYSAVQNGVQVLGENTIRYLDSTLPATGAENNFPTAFALILFGLILVLCSHSFYGVGGGF
ncbi:MAG: hypothetical protein U0R17_05235 [Acidimicrobiia bacterium]